MTPCLTHSRCLHAAPQVLRGITRFTHATRPTFLLRTLLPPISFHTLSTLFAPPLAWARSRSAAHATHDATASAAAQVPSMRLPEMEI